MKAAETTDRQAEVLQVIQALTRSGQAPTREEIAVSLGVKKANVQGILKRLQKAGLVDWTPRQARSLRLISSSTVTLKELSAQVDRLQRWADDHAAFHGGVREAEA